MERCAKAVYTPDDEPYLGRTSVYHFDQVILSCLERNEITAVFSHLSELSDLQRAACQIIPQGVNLAMTIRELVRQGFLFGALVLMRPLIERAAIISYLNAHPEAVATWEDGWNHRERPRLSIMLETMSGNADPAVAGQICDLFNHIVHGDPLSSQWNLIPLPDGALGHSSGKMIDSPELCDFICFQTYCYLLVLTGMMAACFPEASPPSSPTTFPPSPLTPSATGPSAQASPPTASRSTVSARTAQTTAAGPMPRSS